MHFPVSAMDASCQVKGEALEAKTPLRVFQGILLSRWSRRVLRFELFPVRLKQATQKEIKYQHEHPFQTNECHEGRTDNTLPLRSPCLCFQNCERQVVCRIDPR